MKIGYKGLTKDMESGLGYSKKEKFVIGETYTKPEKDKPVLCSTDGYHYCNELSQVFSHYANNGSNRFFKIEVLGKFNDGGDKSITTSFKLLEEISKDEIDRIRLDEHFNIDLLKGIQKKFPMMHVGGSVGLYLHGVRLKRWNEKSKSDFDMISPYFILPDGQIEETGDEIEYLDAKASANDFDETFVVGGVKVDYRIDPKQRYEIIEYDGFKFKVSNLLTILEAKMRYAMLPNGKKHKDDLEEMVIKVPKKTNKTTNINELFK
jgi:hypothetical protein